MNEGNRAKFKDLYTLSKVGMPIMISGLITMYLFAADRTIIATFLSAEELGHYALAGIAISAIATFPSSINLLLYPRAAATFGKRGSSRHLRRYIWIGLGFNLGLMLPIALVGWFALPYLVNAILPAYAEGIPAAKIALIGGLFTAYSGPSVIISVLRKNLPSQVAGIISIGIVWACGIWAVHAGYGIVGVAIARVAGMGVYGVFVIGFVLYLTHIDIPFTS
jgi:O-antigen/teichoic acid export membrane protein